jgi:hypothetical protein
MATAAVAAPSKPETACAETEQTLGQCKELLFRVLPVTKALDEAVKADGAEISALDQELAQANSDLQSEKNKDRAWYRRTEIVAPVAFILGAIVYGFATRGK